MKNNILKTTALALFLFIGFTGFSQDKIYKKNKDVILCTVTELGDEEVKYTMEDTDNLIYVLSVDKISKIVFASGKEVSFTDSFNDSESYAGQKKNAFKAGLFSPLVGALNLGYEKSLKPGQSIEGTIGFIGLGTDNAGSNPGGAYLKAGYKFISTPDFKMKGMRYSHILKGAYVRPEISFSFYQDNIESYDFTMNTYETTRESIAAGALMINFGKQWVFGDAFLIDLFVGLGYGFDNMKSVTNNEYLNGPTYHYGFAVGSEIPIASTVGFKIGFLTK